MDGPEPSVLGQEVRGPVERLDVIPTDGVELLREVRFHTDELVSMCPITGQPDLSALTITYVPVDGRIIESKSLKLYLWGFRTRGIFCEQIASEVADRVATDSGASQVTVVVRQSVRGGIVTTATAALGEPG
jgi:7-cyano-7-deazaguanine reductase